MPPASPPADDRPLDRGRGGEAVPLGQLARHIGLRPPEQPPPPDVVHVVVRPLLLEVVVVGQGVIGPPHPAGHPVGQQTVDAVVAPGQEEEHHARYGNHQRGEVEDQMKFSGSR